MKYPDYVTIIEVGPRDGLQNEQNFIPSNNKIELINQLSESGIQRLEVTSFVSKTAIPQLADHLEVYQQINKSTPTRFSVLIPNERGMLQALEAGVKEIAIFTAASEAFNQRNIRCSIADSINRFIPVIHLAKQNNIKIRAYISCALGCPYEGAIAPQKVTAITKKLMEFDLDEICLGDTIGVGTPKQTQALMANILEYLPLNKLAMHFHDTYNQAIANIYASLQYGVHCFDSSVAGLGGCPYARGASGNVATEDMIYLMHGLGIETGIDIYKIVRIGEAFCKMLGRINQSKVARALLAK